MWHLLHNVVACQIRNPIIKYISPWEDVVTLLCFREKTERTSQLWILAASTVFSIQSFYICMHPTYEHSYMCILSRETLKSRCIEDNSSANYKAARSAVVEL